MRLWTGLLCAAMVGTATVGAAMAAPPMPNVVLIYADDLGWGDLGCQGHPTIRTPNIDRMAAEGMRFTQFYSAAPVCTPSRAALMTGRLPQRSGLTGDERRVLYPTSKGGLQAEEFTIAEALKSKGYATMCVGKWHLGHLPQYLPTRQGFDHYFGIPYSNDMKPCPLMRDEATLEEPAVQETLTARYTDEAVKFIYANRKGPFFLYFAHTFPHVPLHASDAFRGRSSRGLYGDVVEELDDSVGRVLATIQALNLAPKTLVIFSSDNGPWLIKELDGGSAGLLRDGKGSTWEGGMRVPGIFWWPGTIKPVVQRAVGQTMDVLPTVCEIAGAELPKDREYDGRSLLPELTGTPSPAPVAPRVVFFYDGYALMAVRKGPWKAHLITRPGYGPERKTPKSHDPPALYNLEQDPSENFDISAKHPDVVADLQAEIRRHRATFKPAVSQVDPQPAGGK